MIVYQGDPAGWETPEQGSAVAIGVFDGVHLGHRRVLRALHGNANGLTRVAMTFGIHPAAVLAPDRAPTRLSTLKRRFELLEAAGIDRIAVLGFDESMRDMTPEEFVDRFLVEGLKTRFVAVGSGFRFGRGASGTTDTLAELGASRGFRVEVVEIARQADEEIRSTLIRERVESGNVEGAAAMLGRPYEMEGIVVPGDGRGRQLGVPTANVSFPAVLTVPSEGVYAVRVGIDGSDYRGVANLGVRPTFDGTERVLEVHVLDHDMDLYGKQLDVGFVRRIREERRFASVDELLTQIRTDIKAAARILDEQAS
ncbi:MAG: bifunctional riboflavin kinase/FAD synthetase [Acidimicrobiia bacterium]|jgi:riboflavin kinase/FMN adenylyltransferase